MITYAQKIEKSLKSISDAINKKPEDSCKVVDELKDIFNLRNNSGDLTSKDK